MTEKDRLEYADVWDAIEPGVIGLCRSLVIGSKSRFSIDEEDLKQEFALLLCERMGVPSFRRKMALADDKYAYTFSVIKNSLKDALRGRKTRPGFPPRRLGEDNRGRPVDEFNPLVDMVDPEQALIVEETKEEIRDLLRERMTAPPWNKGKLARLISRRVVSFSHEYRRLTGKIFDGEKGVSQAIGFGESALFLASQLVCLYWIVAQTGMPLILTDEDLDIEVFNTLVDPPPKIGQRWRDYQNSVVLKSKGKQTRAWRDNYPKTEFDLTWLAKDMEVPYKELYNSVIRIRAVAREVMNLGKLK
jgi:DNA-directed RNA polymerase specialized sigma24 family protein